MMPGNGIVDIYAVYILGERNVDGLKIMNKAMRSKSIKVIIN